MPRLLALVLLLLPIGALRPTAANQARSGATPARVAAPMPQVTTSHPLLVVECKPAAPNGMEIVAECVTSPVAGGQAYQR